MSHPRALRRPGAGQAEPVPARRRQARRRDAPARIADGADRLVRHAPRRARGDGVLRRHDTLAALPADDLCLRAARALQAASAHVGGRRHHDREARPVGRRSRRRQLRRRVDAARAQPPLAASTGRSSGCCRSAWRSAPTCRSSSPARTLRAGESASGSRRSTGRADVVRRRQAGGRRWPRATSSPTRRWPNASPLLESRAFPRPLRASHGEPGAIRETEPDSPRAYGTQRPAGGRRRSLPRGRSAAAALHRTFGNSRMTGSGSAVFARAGHGLAPSAAMPSDWPAGWSGRMCRSLAAPSARRLGRPSIAALTSRRKPGRLQVRGASRAPV